jgi:hypothetical protein
MIGNRYQMCGQEPVEKHHMVTSSRGGLILDAAGETAHLAKLCATSPPHARALQVVTGYTQWLPDATASVTSGEHGKPVYVGPDEYLSNKYP